MLFGACVVFFNILINLSGLPPRMAIKMAVQPLPMLLLYLAVYTHASLTSKCVAGCSNHGTCNEELGRCDCPRHRSGPTCEVNHARDKAGIEELCDKYSFIGTTCMKNTSSSGTCLNDCNQRGTCVNGWCHCRPPYYGADCCLSFTLDGPVLLEGLNYTRAAYLPRVVSSGPLLMRKWPTQQITELKPPRSTCTSCHLHSTCT